MIGPNIKGLTGYIAPTHSGVAALLIVTVRHH